MKLSQLKQQIEDLDTKAKAAQSQVEFYDAIYERDRLMAENAPELLRRLLVAEGALEAISNGSGPYSRDLPKHADNVIKKQVGIATAALATIRGEEE